MILIFYPCQKKTHFDIKLFISRIVFLSFLQSLQSRPVDVTPRPTENFYSTIKFLLLYYTLSQFAVFELSYKDYLTLLFPVFNRNISVRPPTNRFFLNSNPSPQQYIFLLNPKGPPPLPPSLPNILIDLQPAPPTLFLLMEQPQ